MNPEIGPDETLDDLLHGELKIIQPRRGFRYAVDALLLAHFSLPLAGDKSVIDLGCGSGVVALVLAARAHPSRVVGVELQAGLADLARRNADMNRTTPRVEIVEADALGIADKLGLGSFDLVVTNPPFRPAGSGHMSPNPEKAGARHEVFMNLSPWLTESRRLIGESGSICVVYPYNQHDRLFTTARGAGLHLARLQYALDRPSGERKLILADFRPQPNDLISLPDLPIETPEGKFSVDGYKSGSKKDSKVSGP